MNDQEIVMLMTQELILLRKFGLVLVFISIVLALVSTWYVHTNTQARRAELFMGIQVNFRELQAELSALEGVNGPPCIPEPGEMSTYVRYWYFVFDEWYVCRSTVFKPLWNDVYAPAVQSALTKGGFREGLLEYFGRSKLMGKRKEFGLEIAPLYANSCRADLLSDLLERRRTRS